MSPVLHLQLRSSDMPDHGCHTLLTCRSCGTRVYELGHVGAATAYKPQSLQLLQALQAEFRASHL